MRKQKFCQIIALLLCGLILISGCTLSDNPSNETESNASASPEKDDRMVITWVVPSLGTISEEYLNDLLKEKQLNYRVEFIYLAYDSWTEGALTEIEQLKKMKEAGEPVDIISPFSISWGETLVSYYNLVKEGFYLPLDDYLKTIPSDKMEYAFDPVFLEKTKIGGSSYVLPVQSYPWQQIAYYRTDDLEKYQIPEDSLVSAFQNSDLNALEGILAKVYEKEPELFPIVSPELLDWIPGYTRIFLKSIGVKESEDGVQAVNILEEEDVLDMAGQIQSMMQKGYLQSSMAALQEEISQQPEPFLGFNHAPCVESFPYMNLPIDNPQNYRCVYLNNNHSYYSNTHDFTYGIGVSAWSKHPDEAFEVLAAVMTDPELSNALIYGKEDENYRMVNGQVQDLQSGLTYRQPKTEYANNLIAYPTIYEPADKYDVYRQHSSQQTKSKVCGFWFDVSPVEEELLALSDMEIHYEINLQTDETVELESAGRTSVSLARYVELLEENGMQKVLDEINRQLAEWQAK